MDYSHLLKLQRAFFHTHRTHGLSFRLEQLHRLRGTIERHENELLAALSADLGKPRMEAYASEIGLVLSDIDYTIRYLRTWIRPQNRRIPSIVWPGHGAVHPEPYGVVLILGPWNYPFQLLFSPLVGALAAGNCVFLKPSEFAPRTAAMIGSMLKSDFASDYITVVNGGSEVAEALLEHRFDYLFFTGSTRVGHRVMAAAARHLTPVTLELGGKCPCLVCSDTRLEVAAQRILWGKCLNAGQTCVAPDYVLVQAGLREPLLNAFRHCVRRFFGDAPKESPFFGRIVNRTHFDRLVRYLDNGHIFLGGEHDPDDLYIAPTILLNPPENSPVMKEEIFGPILPVVEFQSLDEVLLMLQSRPKPLALYLFSENRCVQARVVAETSSGGVCINDTICHILGKHLPFGGVGDSGMGQYHGRASFDTFTHYRSVLRRGTRLDPAFRYPPYTIPLGLFRHLYRLLIGR